MKMKMTQDWYFLNIVSRNKKYELKLVFIKIILIDKLWQSSSQSSIGVCPLHPPTTTTTHHINFTYLRSYLS